MKTETELEQLRNAVRDFSELMMMKLGSKINNYSGWNNRKLRSIIINKLYRNADEGDWVDVANLAMMLHRFDKKKG